MDVDEQLVKVFALANSAIEATNTINKRLITAIIVMSVSFTLSMSLIAYFYFYNQNSFPAINQVQSQSNNSNPIVDLKKGDKT